MNLCRSLIRSDDLTHYHFLFIRAGRKEHAAPGSPPGRGSMRTAGWKKNKATPGDAPTANWQSLPTSWLALANRGAVRGADSRATPLNAHHVAHMYRVEVTTPHPDGQTAEAAACVTAAQRAKSHRRPPVAPRLFPR